MDVVVQLGAALSVANLPVQTGDGLHLLQGQAGPLQDVLRLVGHDEDGHVRPFGEDGFSEARNVFSRGCLLHTVDQDHHVRLPDGDLEHGGEVLAVVPPGVLDAEADTAGDVSGGETEAARVHLVQGSLCPPVAPGLGNSGQKSLNYGGLKKLNFRFKSLTCIIEVFPTEPAPRNRSRQARSSSRLSLPLSVDFE